jgi:hypothetical protein
MSDPIFDKNSYVAFDGTSMRDLIISRLNQGKVFTDQNYQGSNFSAFIDVIGYTFSTLLFYLNKTASEGIFSESQIYENMNRIVKLLNYNPIGRLGQNVPFTITTQGLAAANYTIPRYSYVTAGSNQYAVTKDITFTKYTDNLTEVISDKSNKNLIYQGVFQEYPQYKALGIDNEVLFMSLPENIYIDHFNIFVYVKPVETGKWEEWTRATDLFLYKSPDKVYEVRINQNKNYEITFGDGINGKPLKVGDIVQIFYLQIDSTAQTLGAKELNNSSFTPYNSLVYNQILSDLNANENYLSVDGLNKTSINNDFPSTNYSDLETVDSIRKNAPTAFRSQYRLVTTSDYQSYIQTNYSNLLADFQIVNNDDYLKGHIKYLYNIGLNEPQKENRLLINQVTFANSCNFNNLYLYFVPNNSSQEYLASPQKEMILNDINKKKSLTCQLVPMDPVYIYLDFYIARSGLTPSPTDLGNTSLLITKNPNIKRSDSSIYSDIQKIFNNMFSRSINKLGQLIDIYELTTQILNIEGVTRIQTYRSDINVYVEGISLLFWNNTYPDNDSTVHTQNILLKYFQFPVFNNVKNITSRVKIIDPTGSIKAADF